VQVRNLVEVIQHACPGGCVRFLPLQRAEFEEHQHEECPKCGAKRFKRCKGRLVPAFPFIDFGVDNVIRDRMFSNPEFCRLMGSGRNEDGDWYQSPAAKSLHERARADISDPNTGCYELGIDWFEPFGKTAHSIGLVLIRCGIHAYGSV
jgi:hypothetical protein